MEKSRYSKTTTIRSDVSRVNSGTLAESAFRQKYGFSTMAFARRSNAEAKKNTQAASQLMAAKKSSTHLTGPATQAGTNT